MSGPSFCGDCGYAHSPDLPHADRPLPGSKLAEGSASGEVDQARGALAGLLRALSAGGPPEVLRELALEADSHLASAAERLQD